MFAAAPCTPLPFSTVTLTDDGGGAFCFSFVPSAAAFAAFGALTSGFANWSTAAWMSFDDARAAEAALHVLDLLLEEMARRK